MINLSGVKAVQARIAQLQERFGMPRGVPGMDFQNMLKKEIQRTEQADKTQAASQVSAPAKKTPAAASYSPITSNGAVQRFVSPAAKNEYPSYSVNKSLPLADQSLSAMIDEAARKYHVDPKLVAAIAEVESGGNQEETSSAGAIGVMQLMPDTAAALGVNPYDKKSNIEGGAKYLRQMLDTFDGDIRKAVAAYNAGPNAVKNYGGIPPYRETQNYVNKVLDIYR